MDNIKITYVNRTMDQDIPKIYLFNRNEIPTFDVLKETDAWRVIEPITAGESREFTIFNHNSLQTRKLRSIPLDSESNGTDNSKLSMVIGKFATDDSTISPCSEIFAPDLKGKSEVTIGIHGNAQDGYRFEIDSWK